MRRDHIFKNSLVGNTREIFLEGFLHNVYSINLPKRLILKDYMTLKTIDTKRYGRIEFLIDEQDLHWLEKFNFYVSKQPTGFYLFKGSHKDIEYLHRLIMNASKGCHVHHKNGNTLDNRRCNLEVLTPKAHRIETSKMTNQLSEEQVKDILTSKEDTKVLAERYNITRAIISNIRIGKSHEWCCPDIPRFKTNNRHTRAEMQEIKYLVLYGINLHILADRYKIALSDLYSIRKGKLYKNIVPKLRYSY